MPRIRDVRATAERVAEVSAGLNARLAPGPAPARPHEPADHMAFRNADGTVSHICICVCDRCWPAGMKTPPPCPDWNDEDV